MVDTRVAPSTSYWRTRKNKKKREKEKYSCLGATQYLFYEGEGGRGGGNMGGKKWRRREGRQTRGEER